jgi:uncharacterized membrane protein
MDPSHDVRHMRAHRALRNTAGMTIRSALLTIHIAGGAAALLSMVVPMLARKGGRLHRRAGWVFVSGMAIVSLTAFALSAMRFFSDPTPAGRSAGLYLFFIAILTAAGVSAGVRVLRMKTRHEAHRHPWDLGLAVALTASSLGMIGYGLATGRALFVAFAVIGLVNGVGQLRYWLRPPQEQLHWWFEHMGQMLGSCIAATTAFLVVNAGRLGAETFSLAVWLTPALVGGPAIAIWTAYYRRKFSGARRVNAGAERAVEPAESAL